MNEEENNEASILLLNLKNEKQCKISSNKWLFKNVSNFNEKLEIMNNNKYFCNRIRYLYYFKLENNKKQIIFNGYVELNRSKPIEFLIENLDKFGYYELVKNNLITPEYLIDNAKIIEGPFTFGISMKKLQLKLFNNFDNNYDNNSHKKTSIVTPLSVSTSSTETTTITTTRAESLTSSLTFPSITIAKKQSNKKRKLMNNSNNIDIKNFDNKLSNISKEVEFLRNHTLLLEQKMNEQQFIFNELIRIENLSRIYFNNLLKVNQSEIENLKLLYENKNK